MIKIILLLVVVVVIFLIALIIIKKKTVQLKQKTLNKNKQQSATENSHQENTESLTQTTILSTEPSAEFSIPEITPLATKTTPDIASAVDTTLNHSVFKQKIPEDATLKRHFLTQAQVYIADLLGERPTDSTLSRHYDSHFAYKLAEYLAE